MTGISGTFRREQCRAISVSAKAHGYDVLFFNFVGLIGANLDVYGIREDWILDVIPFDRFDGIIFDNNNVFIDSIREKIHDRLKSCTCPIISISEPCDDFCQICFDNSSSIKEFVDHFVKVHGFTRIGFMSGIEGHPDATERLDAFTEAMKENGLPPRGEGVFYGDFWYNKKDEAAEFFINECGGLPQAIICANDFMAMSLCDALEKRGYRVPEDVCISGYDDVIEGRTHQPSISSAMQDQDLLAEKIFELFDRAAAGGQLEKKICIPTTNVYRASCGCKADEEDGIRDKNMSYHRNISFLYNIYDAEAAMLSLTALNSIDRMEEVFEKHSLNFGPYEKFFLFAYTDSMGVPSYNKAFFRPTHTVKAAISIDRSGTSVLPDGDMSTDMFIPPVNCDEPQCCYITHINFGDHCFGYSAVTMDNEYPFNEFYNIWTVNLAVSLETLMQRNSISSLVSDLEKESTHDRLTGLLNRRGFEDRLYSEFEKVHDTDMVITAVMMDLDGLKYINDYYGHGEGDVALSAMGRIISSGVDDSVICGRTGGDEFYAVMFGKDIDYAESFVTRVRHSIDTFNKTAGKKYVLAASCGIHSHRACDIRHIDSLLRTADERMYAEKRSKHAERR